MIYQTKPSGPLGLKKFKKKVFLPIPLFWDTLYRNIFLVHHLMNVMLGKLWETTAMSRMLMQPYLLVRVIVIVDMNKFEQWDRVVFLGKDMF